jgi:ABC-type amino acid transport substrate-binding protein
MRLVRDVLASARLAAVAGVVIAAALTAARPATAQQPRVAPTVTVLTDAMDGTTIEAQAIAELARAVFKDSGLRVLAMAGRGAADNVNDLLYFKGIDAAVVALDVFDLLDLEKSPIAADARRKLRTLVPMLDRTVYVLAKPAIRSWADLRGKTVGTIGRDSAITSRVMFGLTGIDVRPVALTQLPLDARSTAAVDALVLVGEEFAQLRPEGTSFALVSVPETPALQRVYRSVVLTPAVTGVLSRGLDIRTVNRTTVLATFGWANNAARYTDMFNFVGSLYRSLEDLRTAPTSVWRRIDVATEPAALPRHPMADPKIHLPADKLAGLAAVPAPLASEAKVARVEQAAPQPPSPSVKVFAGIRRPLADPTLPAGGLVFALLDRALAMTPKPWRVDFVWRSPDATIDDAPRAAISGPWIGVDCDAAALDGDTSILCDRAVLTRPILSVGYALFGKDPGVATGAGQLRLCHVPVRGEVTPFFAALRSTGRGVDEVRRSSLVDCVIAVETGDVDAFVAIDFEAATVLSRLGLAERIRTVSKATEPRAVQFAVSKDWAEATRMVAQIDRGLAQLRDGDRHIDFIAAYIAAAQSGETAATLR